MRLPAARRAPRSRPPLRLVRDGGLDPHGQVVPREEIGAMLDCIPGGASARDGDRDQRSCCPDHG